MDSRELTPDGAPLTFALPEFLKMKIAGRVGPIDLKASLFEQFDGTGRLGAAVVGAV